MLNLSNLFNNEIKSIKNETDANAYIRKAKAKTAQIEREEMAKTAAFIESYNIELDSKRCELEETRNRINQNKIDMEEEMAIWRRKFAALEKKKKEIDKKIERAFNEFKRTHSETDYQRYKKLSNESLEITRQIIKL